MANSLENEAVASPDRNRIPTGQFVTSKMPVMSAFSPPQLDTSDWRIQIFGLVDNPLELSWQDYLALTYQERAADFHCVTQWTRLNIRWSGVQAMLLIGLAQPTDLARFAMLHCADGYTTNIDIEALREPDVMFVSVKDGRPLDKDHGGPVRLVVPARYGWKSAKWVTGVELLGQDEPGFWEKNGYHMRGDPWSEERFAAY